MHAEFLFVWLGHFEVGTAGGIFSLSDLYLLFIIIYHVYGECFSILLWLCIPAYWPSNYSFFGFARYSNMIHLHEEMHVRRVLHRVHS
jgi:hypothetical protein